MKDGLEGATIKAIIDTEGTLYQTMKQIENWIIFLSYFNVLHYSNFWSVRI